jgi:SAM-dependent methyltransferase
LKNWLPVNSNLLELGSGPGNDWNILSKYYEVIGSDNSSEFLDYLKNENPDGEFFELDAITLNTDISFDGIYSNKVLHHLKNEDLEESILNQYKILKPGGIICHSFWKGKGTEIFKGLFVNYHNEIDLEEFFAEGFEIILLKEYKEFEDGDSLLIIARKVL